MTFAAEREGFVGAWALLLAGVVGWLALGWQFAGKPAPLGTPTFTPTFTPTPSPTPTFTPTPTSTSTPTKTPQVVAGAKVCPPLGVENPQDHYWLKRPIGPEGQQWASHYYPYGSDAHGNYLPHRGVDIENPMGTPVLAAAGGKVVFAGSDVKLKPPIGPWPDFYGNAVIVELERRYRDRPVFCVYGHLSKVLVREGEKVEAGQVLGLVGMTGIALGPHLHFEVRVGENSYENTRNPELWLEPFPENGTLAGRLVDAGGCPISKAILTLRSLDDPERGAREVWTYIEGRANPDDEWGENFVAGDLPAGRYILEGTVRGHLVRRTVEISAGKTTFVAIQVR